MDSALGKPENLFAYSKPNLFELAASYTFGLVKNPPFIDGNKRTRYVSTKAARPCVTCRTPSRKACFPAVALVFPLRR
jgi:hypothetical protein